MNIKCKFIISLSIILTVFGAILHTTVSEKLMLNMEDSINNSLKEVMKSTGEYVRYRLVVDDVGLNEDGLNEDSAYISKNICLNYDCNLLISNMTGKVIQNNISKSFDSIVSQVIKSSQQGKAVVYLKYSNHNLYGILSYPIYENGSYIGIITITKEYTQMYSSSRNTVKFISIIEGIVFLSIFILAFFITSRITSPISVLTNKVKEVADGNYNFDIKIKSKDEIGILAKEFINMKNRIHEQMETIRREKEKVEKLEKTRTEFFNNVTHELKTPLTSISGYSQMLLSGMIEDKEFDKRAVERIYSESERLHNMVLTLIDISKGNTSVSEEKKQISMYKLLNEICDDMSMKAKRYTIRICRSIEEGIILGQPNKIRELIINILDNAIKYSIADSDINVNSYIHDNYFELEVINKSEPIPDKIYNKIFEPFVKSEEGKERQNLGLGLYICSQIIKEHHGEIKIENGCFIKVKVKIPLLVNNLAIS